MVCQLELAVGCGEKSGENQVEVICFCFDTAAPRGSTCFRGRVPKPLGGWRQTPEGAWLCSAAAEKYDMGMSYGEGESETVW